MTGAPPNPALLSLAHLSVIDADPLMLIDAAAAGRFDAIGLRIVRPMPTDTIVDVIGNAPLIREIERRLKETGIRVFDVEAVWLMPHTDVGTLEAAFDLGARLGARHMLVIGNDPDPGRLQDNFGRLCAMAARVGLGIALEPMSYVSLRTLNAAQALIDAVQPDKAGILVDALHFYRAGGKAADLAAFDPALFPYMHLCDAWREAPPAEGLRPEGRGGRFYPGEGALPLGEFLRAMPQGIPIGIEAPCALYAHLPPVERARICGAATRSFLGSVFR